MKECIFVSSVQKELAGERKAVRDFVKGDPLLSSFFDVFLLKIFRHLINAPTAHTCPNCAAAGYI